MQKLAKKNYNVDLSLDDVKSRMAAYDKLCPELKHFLDDEGDAGEFLTAHLGLSKSEFADFTGRPSTSHEDDSPPWLREAHVPKVVKDQLMPATQETHARRKAAALRATRLACVTPERSKTK